jgi:hypothetical protein
MTVKQYLKAVIEEIRRNRFVEEYQDKATEMECLGVAIASYFDWDSRVVEAFSEALTDANFHTLRQVVDEEADKYFARLRKR